MHSFIRNRLDNRVPLMTVLWRDMYVIGTGLNLLFLALAFAVLAANMPDWTALAVFLIPLPYNLFIWSAVWRQTMVMEPLERIVARCLATLWLAVAFVI